MGLGNFISRIFTWWNGETIGTQIFTWRKGIKVGEDDQGNLYFRDRKDTRRRVKYNGEVEASRVSPEWHGWLHKTWKNPPTEEEIMRKKWEKPHQENLTGSALAYAPSGSMRNAKVKETSDYEPWTPN
mgnify:FL=1